MSEQLKVPIQYVKGVGPKRARLFEKAHIETSGDLLKYLPFRYEDRRNFVPLAEVRADRECVVQGKVVVAGDYATSRRGLKIFEMILRDDSGTIQVKFFNQPYLKRLFERDQTVVLFGVPKRDSYSGGITFINPEFELIDDDSGPSIHTGRIVPVYRRIGRLTSRVLRQIVFSLLSNLEDPIDDSLPSSIRERWGLPDLRESFQDVHFPRVPKDTDVNTLMQELAGFRTPAQRRLIFDEFFTFQVGLMLVRRRQKSVDKKRPLKTGKKTRERLKEMLPFHPTGAQKRTFREIVEDLRSPAPMSRLLQGDVGSGKTIVALEALVVVIENGYQGALMAPTELLAEQHFATVEQLLAPLGYQIGLLTGSVKGAERKRLLREAAEGSLDLLVGTHALIEGKVEFDQLGLVIIDEQHRFGVVQRFKIMEKGSRPDTLVMTATPIPRSLAMTVYGDLAVSVIDELPPGRKPVRTVIKKEESRNEVYRVLRRYLDRGQQAYIVYPLVEESEKLDLKAATDMAARLKKSFSSYSVGLMHGQLRAEEKEQVMEGFLAGEIQILVSTTVIEVGIDVPNAGVMVIEHAERFGLSQLHQLRGRVGRGSQESLCILMVDRVTTEEAYQRLEIMRQTNDGFRIAEKDLEIRGPGDFLGTRQSGMPEFLIANLVRDRELLKIARNEAEKYVEQHASHEMKEFFAAWRRRYRLFEVG